MFLKLFEHLAKTNSLKKPYRGVIVDNNDPNRLMRVKVFIHGLLEDQDYEKLPWIYPKNSVSHGGSRLTGLMNLPAIGTQVIIEFPTEDIYAGFYTSTWQSKKTHQPSFNEDYPNTYGMIDEAGNQFKINKTKNYTDLNFASGVNFRVNGDSSVELRAGKEISFVSEDNKTSIKLDLANGKISITPREEIQIVSSKGTLQVKEFNIETGISSEKVSGAKITEVVGGSKLSIGGSSSTAILSNQTLAVGGDCSTTVAQSTDATYGLGYSETVVFGDALTRLVKGDRDVEILLGNYKAKLIAGNYDVDIIAGNVTVKTKAGSLELGNLLGNINIGIDGSIKIKATTTLDMKALVSATLEGTAKVDIKSTMVTVTGQAMATVKAPMIMLGNGTAPILTQVTSPVVDMITGTPSIGVPTILAG